MTKISSTIASNFIIAGAGRLIGGVFAFGAIALMARTLGPDGFGEYATVTAFLYIFNALADFGLYSYLIREISKNEIYEKDLVSQVLSLRMAVLILLLCVGIVAGYFMPYSEMVKKGFFISAISYFFLSSAQVLMGVFQKQLVIWKATVSEIVSRSVQFVLVVYLFFIDEKNVFIFLTVLAVASLTNFILVWYFASAYTKISVIFSWSKWKYIIKGAFPIALSLVFTLIYFRLDTVLLSVFKSQYEVGIYNIAYKLLENIIFYPSMLVGLMMPMLAKEAFTNSERFKNIFGRGVKLILISATPMLVGGIILAEEMIVFLGGPDFVDAIKPFQILLGATFFIFFGTILGAAVIALNKQREAVFIYFAAMIFNIISNIILIPSYGYIATSVTTLITEFIVTVGLAGLIIKYSSWPGPQIIIKIIISSCIMALPILVFREGIYERIGLYALPFWLLLSPIIYGLSLILIRTINKEDINFLLSKE